MRSIISILLNTLILTTAVTALASTPPILEVPALTGRIDIDGDLSDSGWKEAAFVTDFTQFLPDDNVKPSVQTKVMIGYDQSNLYLAFVCQDDPSKVRATLSDRDGMFADDFIGIILDTYGNAAWAYEFYVNALGVQGDLRWVANGGEDSRFDLVFESDARMTEDGWQAEMAIPFSSLRFPGKDEQSWRATFWRSHPRDNTYKYSWAPLTIGEPCFFCQFGYLNGIKNVKPGSKLDVLPSMVASQSSYISDPDNFRSDFVHDNPDAEAALNIRYQLGTGVMVEGALNPDFSQIESDAAQIDVNTTFGLYYPERRPFFQEGSDLYGTYRNVLYTRSINDPDVTFKLTGRMDRTSFFYMAARDKNTPYLVPMEERSAFAPLGKSTSNIARIRHSIFDDSFVGALITNRQIDGGGHNTVISADAGIRFYEKIRFETQLIGSRTEEPNLPTLSEDYLPDTTFDGTNHTVALDGEEFDGHSIFTSLQRVGRTFGFHMDYMETSPTFRANNGFMLRNGTRSLDMWYGIYLRPNGSVVTRISPAIDLGRVWDFDGQRKDEWVRPILNIDFTGQTSVYMNFVLSRERLHGVWFDDIRKGAIQLNNNAFEAFRFGGFVSYGNSIARNVDPLPVMGRETLAETWCTIKPMQQFTIRPSYTYYKILDRDTKERIEEGYILRSTMNYQFTREMFVRLIVEYNDFSEGLSFEPLFTYKINPFTVFYIGSSHGYDWEMGSMENAHARDRLFFMKLQYLFRT
ncbi:MAG: carbohydrate binding family 9 domain-containing protein [candidate division Zixibacteria bacterium]|nr:carbohydrate binding family 9 domain-containing protein [candidate division Zixibacteria bacterium]